MKALRMIAGFLMAGCLLWAGLFVVRAQRMVHRIQRKAARAQAEVKNLALRGEDPSAIISILGQVRPALDSGDATKAEALLDLALGMPAQTSKVSAAANELPVFTGEEKGSGLYVDPQPVTIAGYDGSAMEPFLSPDGQFLFFNNENDPKVDTNLYFATRTGTRSFRYAGELPGVNSPSLDAVPSIDASGHFYFTTLREYDRTMNSIYTGDFDGRQVRNVRPVAGTISGKTPFTVNMDASISPDGQTLYISRAVIVPGAPAPRKSELMVARRKDGVFAIAPDSEEMMRNIDTGPLAYAPAIAANGLELYFTRASQSEANSNGKSARVRIVVATRSSVDEPFDEPKVLSALEGFVEAPSISMDGREMFFHKKVGKKYFVYRAVRSGK